QGHVLEFPRFAKDKMPGPKVIQRMGRERVLGITVRKELPRWHEEAILEANVKMVGHPKLDMEELPEAGQPFRFSIEVSVKPKARLGTYKGLKVVRREPAEEFREAVVDAAVEA